MEQQGKGNKLGNAMQMAGSALARKAGKKIGAKVVHFIFVTCAPWSYLAVLILFLLFIMAAIISQVPFASEFGVGDEFDNSSNAMGIEEMELNEFMIEDMLLVVHPQKPKMYLHLENNSYPRNFFGEHEIYETTETITDGVMPNDYYYYDGNEKPHYLETNVIPMESYSAPFRTFYELFAITDIMMDQANTEDPSIPSDVFSNLKTEFEYTFDCKETINPSTGNLMLEDVENYDYYENYYSNIFTTTTKYVDNQLMETTYTITRRLERVPKPYVYVADTSFFTYTFLFHEKEVIEETRYNDNYRYDFDYKADEDGEYVYFAGGYGSEFAYGIWLEDVHGIDPDTVDMSLETHYKKVLVEYYEDSVITGKTDTYMLQKLVAKNQRVPGWIEGLKYEKPIKVEDIENMASLGSALPDSYEFVSEVASWLGKSFKVNGRMISSSLKGDTGNYKVISDDSEILFPIKFDNGSEKIFNLTSLFGYRDSPIDGAYEFHTGIDIAAPLGTPILAADEGIVVLADWVSGYGWTIVMEHPDGKRTLYGHCSGLIAKTNEEVLKGDVIALVGSTGDSTGNHLHFEVQKNGKAVDPLFYLNIEKVSK